MVVELFFIRHAESESNTHKELIGGRSTSTPLTTHGLKQAELLGERLALNKPFHRLYSSPARRAYDTACIAAKHLQLPINQIIIDDNLQELDQGDWQGELRSEVYTPEVLGKLREDCWNFIPPNGESQKMVLGRMNEFMGTIMQDNLEKAKRLYRIGIFSHGVAIKCLLCHLMRFDPDAIHRLWIGNTSITKLQATPEKIEWKILAISDTGHLYGTDYESSNGGNLQ